jgi:hypothetical protein
LYYGNVGNYHGIVDHRVRVGIPVIKPPVGLKIQITHTRRLEGKLFATETTKRFRRAPPIRRFITPVNTGTIRVGMIATITR